MAIIALRPKYTPPLASFNPIRRIFPPVTAAAGMHASAHNAYYDNLAAAIRQALQIVRRVIDLTARALRPRTHTMETYGLSLPVLINSTGVHPDTARRWKRVGRVPHPHAEILKLRLHGALGHLDPAWSGWHLRSGVLWTPEDQPVRPGIGNVAASGEWLWAPENQPVRPGDVQAIPYRMHQLRELERLMRTPQQFNLF